MADWKMLRAHRSWEDWLGLALGIVIGLAPWMASETPFRPVVLLNAAVCGFLVVVLSELDLVKARWWPEVGQLVIGAWVACAPQFLGYDSSGPLRFWHFGAGLLVVLLALLELWQQRSGGARA